MCLALSVVSMSSEGCSFDLDLDLSSLRTPSLLRSPDLPCRFASLTAGSSETAGAELPLFSAHGSAGFSASAVSTLPMRDADFASFDVRLIAVLCVELPGLLSVAVINALATSPAKSAAKLSPLARWQASIRLMLAAVLGRPWREAGRSGISELTPCWGCISVSAHLLPSDTPALSVVSMSSEACSFDFDLDLSFLRTPSVLRSPDLPCRFTSLTAGSSETAGAELPLFSAHGSAGFSARWIAVLCVELPILVLD